MSYDRLMTILEENKKVVDNFIFQFLPREHKIPEVKYLYEMMRDYPSRRAKGLRSSLCMIVCEAFGGDPRSALITAAAIELFQNWILIHDDIEDDSDMRRGAPTLHKKYGIPLALNVGDALHGRMWECLLKNREIFDDRKVCNIISEFSRMVNETTEGQHIELMWIANNRWDLTEEDYYRLCEKKTSWYTCITPCRLGAIIANAPSEKLDELIPFGRSLGIAFQITDDILNLESDVDKYGKETFGDIWESKRTLMVIHLLKVCNSDERERVLKIMSKKRWEKKDSEVFEIYRLMKSLGVIEYARKKSMDFASEAMRYFDSIFGDLPEVNAKQTLREIIKFMIMRQW
ncbi:MAG: polyprenyl synthetase family protein [Nitrososphaerota archaeon]|nr:polyprenyl synthetase family protein [Nitrososphaerales archaeon]MDW8045229.1 polyprenyl synthetase family protein [Nitrososphaerota archaeon]